MWKFSPKIIFFILACLMLINGYQVNGVKLQCTYVSRGFSAEDFSFCEFSNHGIFNGLRVKIDSVEMTYAGGESINDVKALNIYQIPSLNYFPENLAVLFKNILGIQVYNSNLQKITIDDLKSFVKLQYLYMHNNKITTIEEGLFSNNPDLKFIYLYNNQISHIDPNVFDNLKNLNTLYLSNNKCKQSFGDANSRSDVLKFIERIQKGECSDEQVMQKKKEAQDQLIKVKQQAEETKLQNQLTILQESNNSQMQILRDQLSAANAKNQELQNQLTKTENDLKTKITELENQLTTLQVSYNNQMQLLNAANVKNQELQDKHSTCEKTVNELNSEKQSCLQRMNEVQSTCLANQQPVNEFNKKIAILSDFLNNKFSDIEKTNEKFSKATEKMIEKIDEIQGKILDDDQKKDSIGDQCLTMIVGLNQDTIILSN